MEFHCSLSDSKFPQISRTLLSILTVLNKVVVWIVSTRPPTFKCSSPFNRPLVTVPSAPITIGIFITFTFHSCFKLPSKVEVIILLLTFFQFYSVVSRNSKIYNSANSLFFFLSGLLAESHQSLWVSFSRTAAGLCIYHLFVWSNLNFLHISQSIALPTQLCLVLYSFYSLRDLPASFSWWSFTRCWETGCLLVSPGLFFVFWPISTIR